jgi:hypothetical protein
MTPDDDILATLRTALDELTDGTEPNDRAVAPLAVHGRRRWMLPAVAAAVAVVVVVASVAVVTTRDRGDGHPVAPTPSGPPITSVAPAMIPWYELDLAGARPSEPVRQQTTDQRVQAWAADDFSRVLVAQVATRPDALAGPTDSPAAAPIDIGVGKAWQVDPENSDGDWAAVYWAPDGETAVTVSAYGIPADALDEVVGQLQIQPSADGPVVVSGLSSLAPMIAASSGNWQVLQPYDLADVAGSAASVSVATPTAVWSLVLSGTSSSAISRVTTPFGSGYQTASNDVSMVWWPIEGSPYWGRVRGPSDRIDEVLAAVRRVPDIEAPAVDRSELENTAPPTTASISATPPTSAAPASTSASGETAQTAPVERVPRLAIGDQIMLGAAPTLADDAIVVDARQNRQASEAVGILRSLLVTAQLGSVVVLQVGTNGPISAADMDAMMTAVADVPLVVMLTVHADRSWIGPNNDLIRSLPSTYPNVRIVDWDLIAQECAAECLTPDGIHLRSTAAAQIYVDAIIAAIDAG